MIKYLTIFVVSVSFALVGCKKSEAPAESSSTDTGSTDVVAGNVSSTSENTGVTAEQLAALEREKEEAIRMAELQIQKALEEQQAKIAAVQAQLEAEAEARELAEQQAAETRERLEALAQSLEEAEQRQAELASKTQSNSQARDAEIAAANEAVQKAKAEAEALRRKSEELEAKRLAAVKEQERIEAQLRAELEKYQEIEDWDYSYVVRGAQYKRQLHEMINAKLKANPNR